jgi:hypothetical protein
MAQHAHPHHAAGSPDCGDKVMCRLCKHVHDHAGCHKCDCRVCPVSMHVHDLHEGHAETHGKK